MATLLAERPKVTEVDEPDTAVPEIAPAVVPQPRRGIFTKLKGWLKNPRVVAALIIAL